MTGVVCSVVVGAAFFVFSIDYLLETEKARQGVRLGNEVRQRASKNLEHSPVWLLYYF